LLSCTKSGIEDLEMVDLQGVRQDLDTDDTKNLPVGGQRVCIKDNVCIGGCGRVGGALSGKYFGERKRWQAQLW